MATASEAGLEALSQATLNLEMRIRAMAATDPHFREGFRSNPAQALKDFLDEELPPGLKLVPLEQLSNGSLYIVLPPSDRHAQSLEKLAVPALKGMTVAGCTSSVPGGTCEQTRTCPTTTTCPGYPC